MALNNKATKAEESSYTLVEVDLDKHSAQPNNQQYVQYEEYVKPVKKKKDSTSQSSESNTELKGLE